MDKIVRFQVLGSMHVYVGDHELTVTARDRALLAALVVDLGKTVGNSKLVDAIWGDRPPRDARNQTQRCVSRVRKKLADFVDARQIISTEPTGYRLCVRHESVDLHQFRRLRDEARSIAAGGDLEKAVELYKLGLGLWRGPAFAGIESPLLERVASALDEERLQALDEYLEIEFGLGKGSELVPTLTELVHEHPYQERLHRSLMLALYRAGRQADALEVYRRFYVLHRDQLGTEPSPDLQQLHHAILNRDQSLVSTQAHPPHITSAYSPPMPRELPSDVAGFTGRVEALKALDQMLGTGVAAPPGPVVISAIAGTAGVGKTALAVHWAHRVAGSFPDGQLYLNLRGYAIGAPMRPIEALSSLLRSLGLPADRVPADEAEASARYRSLLADQRVLILLDNARSADQVRPLLPGSPGCLVVVTSRDSLAGFVAVQGANRVDLDLLTPAEAIALLRRLIGSRVDAEPDAAIMLAGQCARLPLALRIAAEQAVARPSILLADLVEELTDRQRRLDLLDAGGDTQAAVEVVFSWSIQHLPPDAAATFRLLGLHPGPDIDAYAAAALTDSSLTRTDRALHTLSSAHLIHRTSPGRYGMHDLLRAFAANLADIEDTYDQRHEALDRLFVYYIATASAAMDSLYPSEADRRPRVPAPATPAPDLSDPDNARTWLDTERPCLVATAAHTATQGRSTHTIQLSATLYRYLDGRHYTDAFTIHDHAYRAAKQVGDLVGQAASLRSLGVAREQVGSYRLAVDHLQQALALFRQAGDHTGEADALNSLGIVEQRMGRHRPATKHFQHSLTLFGGSVALPARRPH